MSVARLWSIAAIGASLWFSASVPFRGATNPAASFLAGDTTIISGVRLFDGERVVESTTVVIARGKIASIGGRPRLSSGVTQIDGAGRTVLPGLIDAHVHAPNREVLRDAARFGVTTVLDMTSRSSRMQALRESRRQQPLCAEAEYVGAGGPVTAKGGYGVRYAEQPTIAGPTEADAFVRDRIAEGSEFIKIMVEREFEGQPPIPTLDPATVKAVVNAAHRNGKLAVAHATYPDLVRVAVESGVDGLAHIWVSARRRSDADTDERLAALIKARGTFVIPTLTILESLTTGEGRTLLEDSTLARHLSERARSNLGRPHLQLKVPFADGLSAVAVLQRAGVPILVGTDAAEAGVEYGISVHREMELLVRAGLSPLDALRAATSNTATAFGLEGRGRIIAGGPADLVLVEGNPTQDILATRRIVSIWKCGEHLDRAAGGATR